MGNHISSKQFDLNSSVPVPVLDYLKVENEKEFIQYLEEVYKLRIENGGNNMSRNC